MLLGSILPQLRRTLRTSLALGAVSSSSRKIRSCARNFSTTRPLRKCSSTIKGMSSRVHLYNITTGKERILDDSSSGEVSRFSMSGNYIVWTSSEFRGSDVPESNGVVFNLKKEAVVLECSNGTSPKSISGNTILVSDSKGIGLCQVSPQQFSNASGTVTSP